MKSLDAEGLVSKTEYMLSDDYTEQMLKGLCRGVAKGLPYLTEIIRKNVMGSSCRQVTIFVYRDEVSMFIATIRNEGTLDFYNKCLPDTVN